LCSQSYPIFNNPNCWVIAQGSDGGAATVRERTIFTLVVLSLILLTVGFLVATQVDLSGLMPAQAATSSVLVDQLFNLLMGVAVVIFLLVEGALVYAVIRFRRRAGDESEGPAIHGNNTLEIVWTLIPAIIVVVISIYSYRVLTQIEKPVDSPLVVRVIGQQFIWSFEYPESGVTSSSLHLPVDRPVQFQIESKDVIHSFWVPEFRIKRDATPGQIDELTITPTQLGRYPIRCAELCGAGHAAMVGEVVVETEEQYKAWIAAGGHDVLAAPSEGDGESDMTSVPDGRSVFIEFGCGACHLLSDGGGAGIVGPVLDGIAIMAVDRVDEVSASDYLYESITAPNDYVVEGFAEGVMPSTYTELMSPEQIDALVEYLLTQ
jgi:cytochrome c oxidase subunit 2